MLDYLWAAMLLLGVVWGLVQGRAAELTQAVLDGGKDAVTLALTMLGVMSVWTGLMEVGKQAGLLAQVNRLLRPLILWLFPKLPKEHPAAESISANFAANVLGLGNAATPAALRAMKELQELEREREAAGKGLRGERQTAGNELRGERQTAGNGLRGERQPVGNRLCGERQTAGNGLRGERQPAGNGLRGESRSTGKSERTVGVVGVDKIYTASDEMCTFLIINISSLQLVPINMIAYRSQYGSADPAAITAPVLIATLASTLVGILFCKAMGAVKSNLKNSIR